MPHRTAFARSHNRDAKPTRDDTTQRIFNYCKTAINPPGTSLPRATITGHTGEKESLWLAKATLSFTSLSQLCAIAKGFLPALPSLSTTSHGRHQARNHCRSQPLSPYTSAHLPRLSLQHTNQSPSQSCKPISSRHTTSDILTMAPMTSEPANARPRRRKYTKSDGKVTSTQCHIQRRSSPHAHPTSCSAKSYRHSAQDTTLTRLICWLCDNCSRVLLLRQENHRR